MIAGAKKLKHTLPLFCSLNLLQINEIYVYCAQLFMYKYHRDCLSSIIFMLETILIMIIKPDSMIYCMCH